MPDRPLKRSQWRPRVLLSVRALMVIVLILGGGLGWVVRCARLQRDAVAAIEAAGGKVFYDWDVSNGLILKPGARRPFLKWLVARIGPDYVGNVTSVSLQGELGARADDALLTHVSRLDHLEELDLRGNGSVTDAGLVHLRGLTRLRLLDLNASGVQGPGLANLNGLTGLQTLRLEGLPVSDNDLGRLSGLTGLVALSVSK
jgi:internalin A